MISFKEFLGISDTNFYWITTESLDTPVKFSEIPKDNKVNGFFTISDTLFEYEISNELTSKEYNNKKRKIMIIDFYRIVDGERHTNIFNDFKGKEALSLFSTLKAIFEKNLHKTQPEIIYVSPNNSKKFKIYKNLFQRYLKEFSYANNNKYSITLIRNSSKKDLGIE